MLVSFGLAFFALSFRLAYIQLIWGAELQSQALDARVRDVPVQASRGVIYDRRGRELAVSIDVESVYVFPAQISDAGYTARTLADVLDLDYERIYDRITRYSSFEWIARKVEDEQAVTLKELQLPGVSFTLESQRYYPKGTLAAHAVGLAGIDNQGLEGIELVYERILAGTAGRIIIELDARGQELPQAVHRYVPPQDGNSLVLTMDETIQYIVERELERLMRETEAQAAMAMFMDPRTGEILALANRPHYDPNQYQDYPADSRRNRIVVDAFPPGSTFKPITAAAGLELGVTAMDDRFYCDGSVKVSGETISCHRSSGHGSVSFVEIVQHSCNVGFVNLGLKLGPDNFHEYVSRFGMTSKSGIDLPGEGIGLMILPENMKPVDLAVMSFGQSLIVTPLQLINAMAAMANGGVLMTPHMLKEVRGPSGEILDTVTSQPIRRVISEQTSAEMRHAMEMVVVDGTGEGAYVEGYRIAGKTGTSQKVIDGAVVHGRYIASFVGFAPAHAPEIIGIVMVDDPVGAYYGGQVAAPSFGIMARDILRYMEVPPASGDDVPQPEPEEVSVPDVTYLLADKAENQLGQRGFHSQVLGEGAVVIDQFPLAGAKVSHGTTVICYTDQGGSDPEEGVVVPRLAGTTIREAHETLASLGLKLQASGNGVAVGQDPDPGKAVPDGSSVTVWFSAP